MEATHRNRKPPDQSGEPATVTAKSEPLPPPEDADSGPSGLDWVIGARELLGKANVEDMDRANREVALRELKKIMANASALLCGIARVTKDSEPETDVALLLRDLTGHAMHETKEWDLVATQLSSMPAVAEMLRNGEITFGHAKALAAAAREVGPELVNEAEELLRLARDLPADIFRRRVRRWLNRMLAEQGVDPLERQRRARRGGKWTDWLTGMYVSRFELDPIAGQMVEQVLDARIRKLWLQDSAGGRDPNDIRTPAQRAADAYFELVAGRDAFSYQPQPDTRVRAAAPPVVFVKVDLSTVEGSDRKGLCEIIGSGPVPRSILEALSPDTELVGIIFGGPGRVLWMGRKTRLANAAQRLAVAIRDGGCFECGAPMHRCQIHHIREWHRDGGPTDIDNLVAVCARHHRWLADNDLEVIRTGDGWRARPRAAEPEKIGA